MNRRKYIFAIYGKKAESVMGKCSKRLVDKHLIYKDHEFIVFENRVYDTGLPKCPVSYNGVSLHFHGIIFPQKCSIDQLSEDRESVLCDIIRENAHDLRRIPYSIRNGSYVAIAFDRKERRFLAFTSFLNSIPFYYAQMDDCIILSTDLELLAKALNLSYGLNDGVFEYYACGTNISDSTAFPEIKCIPKGAYLEFKSGIIIIDYYYRMPSTLSNLSFSEHVNKFAELWKETLRSVDSDKFRYGLGLTGGIDSRLILAAMPDRSKPMLFTGAHPDNPDVVLAKHITQGLGLKNHVIEDYSNCDRVKGYAKYCAMSDNPYHCNSLYTHEQMLVRKEHGLVYQFSGLTEFIGGEYHYRDRRSVLSLIKMTMPPTQRKLTNEKAQRLYLLKLGLRDMYFARDLQIINRDVYNDHVDIMDHTITTILDQMGNARTEETFLERFRHIHKMSNMLIWSTLPARRYVEHVSPSMNIELTDFTCNVPLKHRDSRKILMSYFRTYRPHLGAFILSGYIFSANSSWLTFKALSPYIKALNHLGIKVPFLQWYIRNKPIGPTANDPVTYEMQRRVCRDSKIIKDTEMSLLYDRFSYDKIRLMRLYNIALMEKRMSMEEDSLNEYLCEIVAHIRSNH